MVKTPYGFEAVLSDQDFQKIGQFACRWAYIEHTIGNCLRVVLDMQPEDSTIMVFPLTLDTKMARLSQLARPGRMTDYQLAVLAELKPLVRAMQYLRNTTLHGVVLSFGDYERTYFNLRSKNRMVNRNDLLSCEALINYACHVTQAFRLSLGEGDARGHTYALPDRPTIPEFLPKECGAFPAADTDALLLRENSIRP